MSVSFVLRCPHCGPREVTDFGFGGELTVRPAERPSVPAEGPSPQTITPVQV